MIDGVTGDAFSAVTLPPVDLSGTAENTEKVIRISRERYGKSRAEIEEKIARWSGVMMENIVSEELTRKEKERKEPAPKRKSIPERESNLKENRNWENNRKEEKIKQSEATREKDQFEAVCSTCEEKITVPFRPDPTRPTFCKECLKDYQRARALAQRDLEQKKEYQEKRKEERTIQNNTKGKEELSRAFVSRAFVSREKPIRLSQVAHIAPKRFKLERKKPNVNLGEVRSLLNQIKTNG